MLSWLLAKQKTANFLSASGRFDLQFSCYEAPLMGIKRSESPPPKNYANVLKFYL
jgi:hypothetical protein